MPGDPNGFDVRPSRPRWLTAVLVAVVTLASTGFAHLFRASARWVVGCYASTGDPTIAAGTLARPVAIAVAVGTVLVAATVGRYVERRWRHRVGIEAVAASARGEQRRISIRATVARTLATWVASAGLVSIGRESAIIESGGAFGATIGRRTGGKGDTLAATGIVAAFAAAYHAPVAAVLYAGEHLGVDRSRRAVTFVVLSAGGAYAASRWWFHADPVFPGVHGSRWSMVALGLVGVVPAALAARGFLVVRLRASRGGLGAHRRAAVASTTVALALAAGAAIAVFPLAAGNGMEAIRHGSTQAGWTLAIALLVGKLVGTAAALGAGTPGGVLSPTMGVAAGAALAATMAGQHFPGIRWGLSGWAPWSLIVMAMAVGVAVGLRSPLVAVFLVPEMLGDYSLVPAVAVVVAVAVVIDRGLDAAARRMGSLLPTGVYDEDA